MVHQSFFYVCLFISLSHPIFSITSSELKAFWSGINGVRANEQQIASQMCVLGISIKSIRRVIELFWHLLFTSLLSFSGAFSLLLLQSFDVCKFMAFYFLSLKKCLCVGKLVWRKATWNGQKFSPIIRIVIIFFLSLSASIDWKLFSEIFFLQTLRVVRGWKVTDVIDREIIAFLIGKKEREKKDTNSCRSDKTPKIIIK